MQRKLARASRILGLIGGGIGIVVLAGGWTAGADVLKLLLPGFGVMMNANTPLGLFLLGMALCLDRGSETLAPQRATGIVCSLGALAIGAFTMLGFDAVSGPSAAPAALNLVLLGLALTSLHARRFVIARQIAVVSAATNCLLHLMFYLYRPEAPYVTVHQTAMAAPASAAFIFLSVGTLLANPDKGLMRAVISRGPGGVLARRLLPLAVIMPTTFGWLTWEGQQSGLYDTAFGLAFFSSVRIVGLTLIIWFASETLNRIHTGSKALQRHGEILEETVAARTAELTRVNLELKEELRARKIAEDALRKTEERYALAVGGANEGLWDWDLITDQIYFSARWKSMVGCSEDEISGHSSEWLDRIHPMDADRVRAELDAHCSGKTREFESEYRILHKDRAYRWVLSRGLAIRDPQGKATRLAGSQTDITQNKVSDSLTGLPNRILFTERLVRAIEDSRRNPTRLFAVLFLDVDRFKVVNDSLGHVAGDQLLIRMAERLRNSLRHCEAAPGCIATWTVARLGGDEFAVLLEDLHEHKQASAAADAILESLRKPFRIDNREVFAGASIGIAPGSGACRSPEEVLRDADTAMYAAKSKGKGQAAFFDVFMGARAKARLDLERDLRQAIEQEDLFLEYQPIVLLNSGQVTGFEALLRWRHPERGLIAPPEFIPIAEETGLIDPIGRWVLGEACRQMSIWNGQFAANRLTISVNLSGKQLVKGALTGQVAAVLKQSGLNPCCLHLEVTESILMEDIASVVEILQQLKNMGIGLTIDDFGTGYSSLSYLHRLPFDTLKIDRSFVDSMSTGKEGSAIVKTIMNLAENLQMNAIGEGIESAQQWAQLQALSCTHGQGFYVSPPLSSAAASLFIERGGLFLHSVPTSEHRVGAFESAHEADHSVMTAPLRA